MQSTIKNTHKNQQWHGWLFVHPLQDEAHWCSHETVVEWCSLEFPQTPFYQYHAKTNSLKPLSTSTTQTQIPSNPFLPVPRKNKFPQTPFYQYHAKTNSLKPLSTSTTQKQIPSNPFPTSTTQKPIPSNPFPPVPHRNQFPQTPSYQYHTETNSLKPLPTSATQKPIPSNPFLPVPHRNQFPQTPSHQCHTETNSLKPLPTSTTQKPIPSNPFLPVPHRNRFFTLLLHSQNSLISDKCLKSLMPVTQGLKAAKAHSFCNYTCTRIKTWPRKKKKKRKKKRSYQEPLCRTIYTLWRIMSSHSTVHGQKWTKLPFKKIQYDGQCHCNYCI